MIADKGAWRTPKAVGETAKVKRGFVVVRTRITNEMFGEIKALALLGKRTMSGQIKELLQQSLEPR